MHRYFAAQAHGSARQGAANPVQKHTLDTLTVAPRCAFCDKGSWILYFLKKVQYIWGQNAATFSHFP